MNGSAVIDPTGTYRYSLVRVWDASLPRIGWLMLNPSTADADKNDPTIRRCIDFSQRWGFGSLEVCNPFAFRATDPDDLALADDPIGPENAKHVHAMAARCARIVAAWGTHPRAADSDQYGLRMECLGKTKSGAPKHPVRLSADTKLEPWP